MNPTPTPAEEIARLRAYVSKLQDQPAKSQAKRKHHLAERDRYRDLYLETQRKAKK